MLTVFPSLPLPQRKQVFKINNKNSGTNATCVIVFEEALSCRNGCPEILSEQAKFDVTYC